MLAEQNLHLVRWTIREYINVREEIEGLGLDDLCVSASDKMKENAEEKM